VTGSARGVGIAVPQFPPTDRVDPAALAAFVRRAEALGFHSLWVQEQILGTAPSLEPVSLLAHVAAVTERIGLGVAVLLLPLRSPVQLAKALATVDQLSGGRLIVGVGLGDDTAAYPAFGVTADGRVRRFAEALLVMKRLWTEERVTLSGRFWTLQEAAMEPKPARRPRPPVWIGAHHPDALRRAVALGDGFMGAGAASTAAFRAQVARVREHLAAAGRDPAGFAVGKRVYLSLDEDRSRGLARLRPWFQGVYGDGALADRVAVVGSAAECVAALREVRAAGAELLLLNFVHDEPESMERAAREIVPALGE
jgi:probable F420-dependent oxidoreductase